LIDTSLPVEPFLATNPVQKKSGIKPNLPFDGLWYGVWSDNNCTVARAKADTTAENLKRHTIPAGTYAAFTSEPGGFAGDVLSQLRDQVINSWLLDSGYEQTSEMEIELYHLWTDREMRRKNRCYELWIPIRRK